MKFQRTALIVSCVVLGSILLAVVYLAILEHQRLYPTTTTLSSFFKEYTPRPVVESFESNQFNSAWGDISSSSAGRKFITNRRELIPDFAIESEKRTPLMNALNDDIYAQLVKRGALVRRGGGLEQGFRYKYILDTSIGTVTLSPMTLSTRIRRNSPLPSGIENMTFQLTIMERWFPSKADVTRATKSW
jgi:hypothetical protein